MVALTIMLVPSIWHYGVAQPKPPEGRPKIGLVLAGGGAKGAAHVGVIKVLEDLGVPIDYIVGTSMGAIVGGLYASGLSAAELEAAVKSIDWGDIFNDKPPRRDRDFRRKLDDDDILIRYKLGFKDGSIQFPRGIILGQKLNLALRDLSRRAIDVDNFDMLAIPFRAVATDIETGEPIALGRGDLATAMRASMAVPGVFPPVEIDDRLLVDGGLADNVPIDVAINMGADILIVVSFPVQLRTREKLTSAISLILQSLNLLIQQNQRLQLETLRPQDIHIVPAMGDIGAGSFDRAADAIIVGETAAQNIVARLQGLVGSTTAPLMSAKRSSPPNPERITVDFVRIVNKSRLADALITSRLRLKVGDKLDTDELEKDIANIYGLDYFETVSYRIVKEEGKAGVVIIAEEKTSGLDSFRFGLNLENDFDGDSAYNLKLRYQKEGMNDLGGELIVEAEAGERLKLATSFLQPLDPGTRYFIVPRFEYLARDVPKFIDGHEVSEFRVSTVTGGLSVARQLANWGAVSLGMEVGYGWNAVNTGAASQAESDFNIGEVFGRFDYDTLDNIYFPNDGIRAQAEFRRSDDAFNGESDFNKITARAAIANTWDKDTIIVALRSGITTDSDAAVQDLFDLGGFLNLSGFQTDELTGQNFALGGLIYYHNIGASPASFGVPIYLGASLEAGNLWDDRGDIAFNEVILAGSMFLGLDTFLGPVYLAYGHAEGGHDSAYLFLGQTF